MNDEMTWKWCELRGGVGGRVRGWEERAYVAAPARFVPNKTTKERD
jgi:hypothetical protein